MPKKADITWQENQFLIQGELDFSNVMAVYHQGIGLFSQHLDVNLVLNFANVQSSNSAGLALIIEWIKYAKTMRRELRVVKLSSHLQSVARAAGINKLIPLA